MPKIIIVGGGYAGLAAATALAEAGLSVELLESKGFLGGRAYSTGRTEHFPLMADNGPHLFMGCYTETLRMFHRIGVERHLHWIDPLSLSWLTPGGKKVHLKCAPLPAPLHLAWGLLTSNAFPWNEKLSMARALSAFSRKPFRISPDVETVAQYLDATHQGPFSRERFWVPLCNAVMNVSPDVAPLQGLGEVLRRVFFGSRADSALGVAKLPLSEMVSVQAQKYLEGEGARVRLHEGVQEFTLKDGRVEMKTRSGEIVTAEALLLAVPPTSLAALWPQGSWDAAAHFPQMGKSPIVSVHLVLSKPVMEGHLVGLSGAKFEWVFNRNANWAFRDQGVDTLKVSIQPNRAPSLEAQGQVQYLSFTASAAEDLARLKDAELVQLAWRELTDRCPAAQGVEVLHSKVTREMAATFVWNKETDKFRPPCQTPYPNVFLAGDWTDTGLPATLEGACLSGHRAAEKVLSLLKK
ncbi:MAG TPA: hydroxysqualene dehydroxylase HpnE [bacterium]|nr:hydroxysqualene dehydroxylase HpnE [bacterium]